MEEQNEDWEEPPVVWKDIPIKVTFVDGRYTVAGMPNVFFCSRKSAEENFKVWYSCERLRLLRDANKGIRRKPNETLKQHSKRRTEYLKEISKWQEET